MDQLNQELKITLTGDPFFNRLNDEATVLITFNGLNYHELLVKICNTYLISNAYSKPAVIFSFDQPTVYSEGNEIFLVSAKYLNKNSKIVFYPLNCMVLAVTKENVSFREQLIGSKKFIDDMHFTLLHEIGHWLVYKKMIHLVFFDYLDYYARKYFFLILSWAKFGRKRNFFTFHHYKNRKAEKFVDSFAKKMHDKFGPLNIFSIS